MFLLIGIFACVSVAYVLKMRGEKEITATERWCDAGDRLFKWCNLNPDLRICDHAYARELVNECIEAYREFLRTHPYCRDENGYEAWLQSLLVPPPDPKTPKRIPFPQRPHCVEAVFLPFNSYNYSPLPDTRFWKCPG